MPRISSRTRLGAREDLRQTLIRDEFERVSFTVIGETVRNSPAHLPERVEDPEKTTVDEAFFVARCCMDQRRAGLSYSLDHQTTRTEIGKPSAVIRFRTLHPIFASVR